MSLPYRARTWTNVAGIYRRRKADVGRSAPPHDSRRCVAPAPNRVELFLAGVAHRRVLLDVHALRSLGVIVIVGAKAGSMDAVNGAQIVDLVDVSGDTKRAHDLPRGIADELAASFEEQ